MKETPEALAGPGSSASPDCGVSGPGDGGVKPAGGAGVASYPMPRRGALVAVDSSLVLDRSAPQG